jgi:hypothetical protein
MYYNYSEEQKYFLSVTDAMLKDDFSVEEIVEFWQSEDQDQVEGILGSLMLTESVDYSNPDLAVVCERFGLGWITKGASRLWKGLRGVNPKTGNPKVSMGSGTAQAIKNTKEPGFFGKIKNWLGGKANKAKDAVKKAPTGVKVAAGTALVSGAALKTMDVLDNMKSGDKEGGNKIVTAGGDGDSDKNKDKKKPEPVKGSSWWKDYDKYDRSNYLHYRNIRKK